MNYLGHWLFSAPTPDALMGSLWPDFAKRPSPDEVSEEFLVHFDRHQWLDKETDRTPILEPLRQYLRPTFRKTTLVVVDMLIDHHLSKNWHHYHPIELQDFTHQCYRMAMEFQSLPLPIRLERTIIHMSQQDWLINYGDPAYLAETLQRISKRLHFENNLLICAKSSIKGEERYSIDIRYFIESLTIL